MNTLEEFADRGRAAQAAANKAIDQANLFADDAWKAACLKVVQEIAARGQEFTTDLVWATMTERHPELATHEARAMGGVMRTAGRNGWCHSTGRYEKTERPEAHARPIMVWAHGKRGVVEF